MRLQTVCVRHVPSARVESGDDRDLDDHTLAWVRSINLSGQAFLSPSLLEDRWMVRISVGVEMTERSHLERLIVLMREAAETD